MTFTIKLNKTEQESKLNKTQTKTKTYVVNNVVMIFSTDSQTIQTSASCCSSRRAFQNNADLFKVIKRSKQ